MKLNLKNKYIALIAALIFVILTKGLEYLFDLVFGNGDGIIDVKGISAKLVWVQIYFILISILVFSGRIKSNILAYFAIFILLIVVLENFAGFALNKNVVKHSGGYTHGFFIDDDNLGYKPRPACQVQSVKQVNKETIYSVIYSIDDNSRRISISNSDMADKFALFFGNSVSFGEGVNDHETLADQFVQNTPDFHSYNFGFCGYGPNQMLAILQEDSINISDSYTDGFAVYTYMDDHLGRALGTMRPISQWASSTPYYDLDKEGILVRKGSFSSGRYLKTKFYFYLGKSKILQLANIDLPLKFNEEHYKSVASIINESAKLYSQKFKNSNYYVLVFPGSENEIIKYLDNRIKILDYSKLFGMDEYRLSKFDLHPTPKGYKIITNRLIDDINLPDN